MIKILDKVEIMNVSMVFLELDGEDLDHYYKVQFPSMLFNPKKEGTSGQSKRLDRA